jgi:hypothetical protein
MRRWALLLVLVAAVPLRAELGEHPQPEFFRIDDPVDRALETAADGQLGKARAALEKACAATPNDAEAWAALAVVYGELKLPREVKRCERHVLAADREQGRAILRTRRASFQERKAEIKAEKQAKGEWPLPVQRLQDEPDTDAFARLERERAQEQKSKRAKAELEAGLRTPKVKSR